MRMDYSKKSNLAAQKRQAQRAQPNQAAWLIVIGFLFLILVIALHYAKGRLISHVEIAKQQVLQKQQHTPRKKITLPATSPSETFAFYNMLPSMNVPVSDDAPEVKTASPTNTAVLASATKSKVTLRTGFIVQIAVFSNAEQADRLRAALIMQGFHAKVITSNEKNKILSRVILGPYNNLNQAKHSQERLADAQIKAIVKAL